MALLGGWTGCFHPEAEPTGPAILQLAPDPVEGTWTDGASFTLSNVGGDDTEVPNLVATLPEAEKCAPGPCAGLDVAIAWDECSSPPPAPPAGPHPLAAGEHCPGSVAVSGIDGDSSFTGTLAVTGGSGSTGDTVVLVFAGGAP